MRRLPSSALRLVRQAIASGGRMLWTAASGPVAPRPVSKAAGRAEAPDSETPDCETPGERTGERTLRIRIRASEVRFRGTTNM